MTNGPKKPGPEKDPLVRIGQGEYATDIHEADLDDPREGELLAGLTVAIGFFLAGLILGIIAW